MIGLRPDPHQLVGQAWDLVVVGGGITGAGVALMAAQQGLRVLLLEKQDYAWGTSSRSSKMVHGGLRYLAQGDVRLTRESLQERERLLRELPDLVHRHTYLFPVRKGSFPGRLGLSVALMGYDFLAGIRDHRWISARALRQRAPLLKLKQLRGAMSYTDAVTDDSRLVLRILHHAAAAGATVVNYSAVQRIERAAQHFQLHIQDQVNGANYQVSSQKVINATGAWVDQLSNSSPRVRPLRGSHIFLPAELLPVTDSYTLPHPDDGRPVFVFPWHGVTCVGTTDHDHTDDPQQEAYAHEHEVRYLLTLVRHAFPSVQLDRSDVISTMAGVRPVISSGKGLKPSQERRDHAVWESGGVVSVSGGKLTTFRIIALDALKAAGLIDERQYRQLRKQPRMLANAVTVPEGLESPAGAVSAEHLNATLLRWLVAQEQPVHLDDLLLRRTRIGNLTADGGRGWVRNNQALLQQVLGWDEERFSEESNRYDQILKLYYN